MLPSLDGPVSSSVPVLPSSDGPASYSNAPLMLSSDGLALKNIENSSRQQFTIVLDSLSALQALVSSTCDHPMVVTILELLTVLQVNKDILFLWVPSHCGISGNEKVDRSAKKALNKPVEKTHLLHCTDLKTTGK